jgi:integrase
MRAFIALLRERGGLPSRRKGSVAPYVWAVAEIAYRCRMRSVEVRNLTDADYTDEGIIVDRTKGSLGNVTRWCPELREAWGWLVARRARIWLKKSRALPPPRPLVVTEKGLPLSKSALKSAWGRAMAVAVAEKVISAESKFGLHGLKHRGVTDTGGGKAGKKEASGHKTDAMLNLYDHEVPVVDPAGKRS